MDIINEARIEFKYMIGQRIISKSVLSNCVDTKIINKSLKENNHIDIYKFSLFKTFKIENILDLNEKINSIKKVKADIDIYDFKIIPTSIVSSFNNNEFCLYKAIIKGIINYNIEYLKGYRCICFSEKLGFSNYLMLPNNLDDDKKIKECIEVYVEKNIYFILEKNKLFISTFMVMVAT